MKHDTSKTDQILRERGLRPTAARRRILTVLVEHENHLSTEEILKKLRQDGYKAGAATIYQNLAKLADAGLLVRFTDADGIIRYDSNLIPHHHLFCTRCGKVIDINLDKTAQLRLRPKIMRSGTSPKGWKLDEMQIEFKGICPRCRRRK
jgi:Fe2+ or Zn2+ uptake regulation protein